MIEMKKKTQQQREKELLKRYEPAQRVTPPPVPARQANPAPPGGPSN